MAAVTQYCGAILAVRISFGVLAPLLCMGQMSFAFVTALITSQPAPPGPGPEPNALPIFLAIELVWLMAIMPLFFWLQWFIPRWFQRRGTSYGGVVAAYVVSKLMTIAAAEGLGFLGLVLCLIFRGMWPFALFSVCSILLLAVNIPRARVLRGDAAH